MTNPFIVIVTFCFIAFILIVLTIHLMRQKRNDKYKKLLDKLEIERNIINSTPISPELSKIEAFLNNEKLNLMFLDWKDRLDIIKNTQIPKLTDMIIEADFSLSQNDYKSTLCKVARLEMEIYKVRTNAQFLLNEIKEITSSEEKSRIIITKLKTEFREIYHEFESKKIEFGEVEESVKLQLENVSRRFEQFEDAVDSNDYTELNGIIKSIVEMLEHLKIVIRDVPVIILMSYNILPNKIKELEKMYHVMLRASFPLDFLNIEENILESNKKIIDILSRTKVLNLEDCIFELKVLSEYFDTLFSDLEKEKLNRNRYEELDNALKKKLGKLNNLIDEIFSQINEIKSIYNLSNDDIDLLNLVYKELKALNNDYKTLVTHTSNHAFAYSHLLKEMENLTTTLSKTEENLDISLNSIGSMRDDEVRARKQLEEIKSILRESKRKMLDFNFPEIPNNYNVQLKEAQEAIKEIVVELEKRPITINVLNTRVDTARDLVFKLFSRTKDLVKCAKLAEMAIVYGNRYRSDDDEINSNLNVSESLFFKGEYQKSLEMSTNTLSKINSNVLKKLNELYPE
ncbi:MAG: septation ring formation regulator EzrA [Mycoplasmatota bacterium]